MDPMSPKRKLAAVLAADAAGYSRLMADDEPATLRALSSTRGIFRAQIDAHRGHLIDTARDSESSSRRSPSPGSGFKAG
jgi:adenylate cyclase